MILYAKARVRPIFTLFCEFALTHYRSYAARDGVCSQAADDFSDPSCGSCSTCTVLMVLRQSEGQTNIHVFCEFALTQYRSYAARDGVCSQAADDFRTRVAALAVPVLFLWTYAKTRVRPIFTLFCEFALTQYRSYAARDGVCSQAADDFSGPSCGPAVPVLF